MKYCEKCGNELKEGYAFCDKCGAKVKAKEEKKEHEEKVKEEKIEKKPEERPVPPVPPPRPPKSGKGKIIFLTILNILLLAATITFLVLWLIKPTDSKCSSFKEKDIDIVDPKPTPKETNQYVGKWEQNIEFKSGTKVTKRTYGLIELKDDNTFRALSYDKSDISGTKMEIEGTYTVSGNKITLKYKEYGSYETLEVFIRNGKMCRDDDCERYLVRDSYNNKITIYDDDDDDDDDVSDIDFITYSEYENLQKNYKDAIVVVVREGCSWCEKFEDVVEEISEDYNTPVYYYMSDGKISISGTPTTIIIKNGYIVDTVEGYKEYSAMEDILDDLGVK
jgi:hypothetical protein